MFSTYQIVEKYLTMNGMSQTNFLKSRNPYLYCSHLGNIALSTVKPPNFKSLFSSNDFLFFSIETFSL